MYFTKIYKILLKEEQNIHSRFDMPNFGKKKKLFCYFFNLLFPIIQSQKFHFKCST